MLRRWKRGCCFLFASLLIAAVLACAAIFVLLYNAYAQAGAGPLDIVLVVDHSNSMWELGGVGSDPNLLRVDAADLFISYLGVDSGTGGHRLAVVHFGSEAELAVPLTPLEGSAQRAAVRQAIADPQRMGWTDPLAALALAYEELFDSSRADPSRRPAVVLLSDGKPERSVNPDPAATAAYLAGLRALVDRFAGQGCPIFTVALANAATDADPAIQTTYRNLWQEVAALTPPAEYHQARAPKDLLRVYHDVVARLSGVEVKPPAIEAEVTGPVTYRVPVEAGLARLTLVVLKTGPSIKARVLRPGGAALRAGDPDVRYAGQPGEGREEVWAVRMPRPGEWTVELDGQGHVVVWKDVSPLPSPVGTPAYTLELLSPPAYVPDGSPLRVAARLRDETGTPLHDPALQVAVELRRAGFPEATLLARDDGARADETAADGILTASCPDPAPGDYTLHLRALREGEELARWEGACEVVPLPRLEALSPAAGENASFHPGQRVAAQVRVTAGFAILDGKALSSLGSLTATLVSGAGHARPLDVTAAGDSFCVETPAPRAAGDYALTLYLAGRTPEGLAFADALSVPFRVLLPPATATAALQPKTVVPATPLPSPPLEPSPHRHLGSWVLALGLATALGLIGAGCWAVRRRAPRLEGRLRVLASPAGQPAGHVLDLPSHRRHAVLGGDELPLPGSGAGARPRAALRADRDEEGRVEILLMPLPAGPGGQGEAVAVNDLALYRPHVLQDGDLVVVGEWRLRYENLEQAARRLTPPAPYPGVAGVERKVVR